MSISFIWWIVPNFDCHQSNIFTAELFISLKFEFLLRLLANQMRVFVTLANRSIRWQNCQDSLCSTYVHMEIKLNETSPASLRNFRTFITLLCIHDYRICAINPCSWTPKISNKNTFLMLFLCDKVPFKKRNRFFGPLWSKMR